MTENLTAKQARFVQEYLLDLNGKQAAIRSGYSEKTAEVQASRLLSNAKVQEQVAEAMQVRSERTQITADQVLQELALIGFADMRKFVTWGLDGVTLKGCDELTEEQGRVVAEVSQTKSEKGGSIKFKLHDKRAALVDMGRHLGMFTDKIDAKVAGSIIVVETGIRRE